MLKPILTIPWAAALLSPVALPLLAQDEKPLSLPDPPAAAVELAIPSSVAAPPSAAAVADMVAAAADLLAILDESQRAKAFFALSDPERENWHFVPMDRKGIALSDLRPDQDHLVYGLLGSALSAEGWRKTTAIMSLEKLLFDLENSSPKRNPENYYLAVFGEPKAGQPWGWRFEGHHLSLNFTIAPDNSVSLTPSFLGANPGEIKDGPRAGLRILADEEDFALELVRSLTPEQQQTAIVPGDAPPELLTEQKPRVEPLAPAGLAARDMDDPQRALLWKVIGEYVDRYRPDLTADARDALEQDGGNLTFAWMGSTVTGEGHYYRIQSPQFLFEYDNTQNGARHPHAVWRDFNGDFGADLLKEHYRKNHSGQ